MKNIKLHFGCKSDKGNIKKNNEDNYIIKSLTKGSNKCTLVSVCDGLGGLSCGEVASQIMVDEIDKWWKQNVHSIIKKRNEKKYIISNLEKLLKIGNEKVKNKAKDLETKIGTTISCLLIVNRNYYIAHVGDSRIYKLQGHLEQLTQDHTLHEKLRICGMIEESNAVKKNILTQCIGATDDISIYTNSGKIDNSCTFLVCSDGYYNKMDINNTIKDLSYKVSEFDERYLQYCCEKLVKDVMKTGERDNITLACVKVQVKQNILLRLVKKINNK